MTTPRWENTELALLADVEALAGRLRERIRQWERRPPAQLAAMRTLDELLDWLVLHNLKLWQLEDIVRNAGLPDAEIVHTKRLIDLENQARTERIEQIDRAIVETLNRCGVATVKDAPLHTESPGMILDRLSILCLRMHMLAQSANSPSAPPARVEAAQTKLRSTRDQLAALIQAATPTFADFLSGRRRFFASQAVKQYGR
jgi:hypothetical protein